MTKIIVAQDAPVLVAIDTAKGRHEVLIAIPDKKRRRRLTVLNELADFNTTIFRGDYPKTRIIVAQSTLHPDTEIIIYFDT